MANQEHEHQLVTDSGVPVVLAMCGQFMLCVELKWEHGVNGVSWQEGMHTTPRIRIKTLSSSITHKTGARAFSAFSMITILEIGSYYYDRTTS